MYAAFREQGHQKYLLGDLSPLCPFDKWLQYYHISLLKMQDFLHFHINECLKYRICSKFQQLLLLHFSAHHICFVRHILADPSCLCQTRSVLVPERLHYAYFQDHSLYRKAFPVLFLHF